MVVGVVVVVVVAVANADHANVLPPGVASFAVSAALLQAVVALAPPRVLMVGVSASSFVFLALLGALAARAVGDCGGGHGVQGGHLARLNYEVPTTQTAFAHRL